MLLLLVAVLLIAGFQRAGYDEDVIQAIHEAWAEVETLGVAPSLAPEGSTTFASFAQDAWEFHRSKDPDDLARLRDWLAGPGPHRLRALGQWVQSADASMFLDDELQSWASSADPSLLPGLLALGQAQITEGGPRDLREGLELQAAVLERLLADDLPVPDQLPRWREQPDSHRRALARRAVALARELDRDPTVLGAGQQVESGWLAGLGAETSRLALRRAAVLMLNGRRPQADATPDSQWGVLLSLAVDGPDLLEWAYSHALDPIYPRSALFDQAAQRYRRALSRLDARTGR